MYYIWYDICISWSISWYEVYILYNIYIQEKYDWTWFNVMYHVNM